jgi:hypothetical protein
VAFDGTGAGAAVLQPAGEHDGDGAGSNGRRDAGEQGVSGA